MSNEPVAWMMKAREPSLHCPDYVTFETPTRDMKISHHPYPLYTHSAKTLTDDPLVNFKPVWIEKPELTLTDAEIMEISKQYVDRYEFAKAILRKAQEK